MRVIDDFKAAISRFKMKDLGELKFILVGMEIKQRDIRAN
jgi:hypothetical protein